MTCPHPWDDRYVESDGRRICFVCKERMPDNEVPPEPVEPDVIDEYLDATEPP